MANMSLLLCGVGWCLVASFSVFNDVVSNFLIVDRFVRVTYQITFETYFFTRESGLSDALVHVACDYSSFYICESCSFSGFIRRTSLWNSLQALSLTGFLFVL